MSPTRRAVLAVLLSLPAPPVAWVLAGHPGIAWAWLAVPFLLAAVRLGPGLGLLPVALHDPVVWLSLLLWLVSTLAVAVVCARGRASDVRWRRLIALGVLYVVGARLVLLAPGQLVSRVTVHSGGMAPALLPGDAVLVARGPLVGPVNVGDVVTVTAMAGKDGAPDGGYTWIKRVVAVDGQDVSMRDGTLLVGGASTVSRSAGTVTVAGLSKSCEPGTFEAVIEAHGTARAVVLPGKSGSRGNQPVVRVPADSIYVVGDHRDRSMDSRRVGPLPRAAVTGRVLGVVSGVSLSPCVRVDLSRLGRAP